MLALPVYIGSDLQSILFKKVDKKNNNNISVINASSPKKASEPNR